jgi:hypothetical protein
MDGRQHPPQVVGHVHSPWWKYVPVWDLWFCSSYGCGGKYHLTPEEQKLTVLNV